MHRLPWRIPLQVLKPLPLSLAASVTLNPVADAYVDQTHPSTNYGTAAELRADRTPVQYGLLRFNVSGLSGSVSQAILRVYTNNALAAGFNLYRVANNTWGETTLTSSNAPTPGALIGSATNCAVSAWASVDVTAYVTGNGTFSFALINLTNDALSALQSRGIERSATDHHHQCRRDRHAHPHRNNCCNRHTHCDDKRQPPHAPQQQRQPPRGPQRPPPPPRGPRQRHRPPRERPPSFLLLLPPAHPPPLLLPPRGPLTTAATSPANAVTLSPVADAYVDQTYPSTNYGTAAELRADRSPVQYGLLRFNVSGLSGSVSQAILRVHTNNALAAGFNLYRVANNTWGETTLTSSNAPAPGTLIGSATNCAVSAWASVDVTTYVTGNGTFSFALVNLTNDAPLHVQSRGTKCAPVDRHDQYDRAGNRDANAHRDRDCSHGHAHGDRHDRAGHSHNSCADRHADLDFRRATGDEHRGQRQFGRPLSEIRAHVPDLASLCRGFAPPLLLL